MNHYASIRRVEKLHDLFERILPVQMPLLLDNVAAYLKDGHCYLEKNSGKKLELEEIIPIIDEIKIAFEASVEPSKKCILLKCENKGYEININPILDLLEKKPDISKEIDELKLVLVSLSNPENIFELKEHYMMLDSLSLVLSD
jgi:hypothetical protein